MARKAHERSETFMKESEKNRRWTFRNGERSETFAKSRLRNVNVQVSKTKETMIFLKTFSSFFRKIRNFKSMCKERDQKKNYLKLQIVRKLKIQEMTSPSL
jgi:hypothetical protein